MGIFPHWRNLKPQNGKWGNGGDLCKCGELVAISNNADVTNLQYKNPANFPKLQNIYVGAIRAL